MWASPTSDRHYRSENLRRRDGQEFRVLLSGIFRGDVHELRNVCREPRPAVSGCARNAAGWRSGAWAVVGSSRDAVCWAFGLAAGCGLRRGGGRGTLAGTRHG